MWPTCPRCRPTWWPPRSAWRSTAASSTSTVAGRRWTTGWQARSAAGVRRSGPGRASGWWRPPTAAWSWDRPVSMSRHCPPADLAPSGGSVVHGLRYIRPDEDPSPDAARAEVEEHARLAGIDPDGAAQVRYLHRMTVVGAVPVPGVGLAGRVDVADTGHDGVLVAGDWVGPRGHLADAALASGEDAGRQAVAALEADLVVRPIMGRAS